MVILYQAAIIILAGILIAGADSLRRPVKTRPDAPVAPGAAANAPALELDITLAQAVDLFNQGAAFIDARNKAEYEAGHVQGAFHLPLEAFSGNAVPEALSAIDGNGPVVVYCAGGDCHASHDVVIKLQQLGANLGLGFRQCHVLKEGYPAWAAAGQPTATGPGPLEGGQ
ncbi:MAG: rhodanese-like domain-containing protein [Phycisphaerae bacterium]|nr:rhodanese-like domain-containing protein [Phycisphaerae bacterium]